MLTSYPDEEAVIAAIIAGATATSSSRCGPATSLPRSRRWSRRVPARSGRDRQGPRADAPDRHIGRAGRARRATQQERKILALVAEGKTNKEIAADVFLSDKTVKNYVSSILAKLNLERRAQAAAYVARLKSHPSD